MSLFYLMTFSVTVALGLRAVLARIIHCDTGPVIIAIAAAVFFVSLLAREE